MEKIIALLAALLIFWGWGTTFSLSAEKNCIQGGLKSDGRDWISKETVEWCIKTF